MAASALQPLKNLHLTYITQQSPRQALSFLALYSRLIMFHDDHMNYSHVKQTAKKRMGVFTGEGTLREKFR